MKITITKQFCLLIVLLGPRGDHRCKAILRENQLAFDRAFTTQAHQKECLLL